MLSKTHTKYIQSLHHKKFRDEDNRFIAEGTKVVPELLSSEIFQCVELYALKEWMSENEVFIRKYYKGPLEVIEPFELEKISTLSTPNKVFAVFRQETAIPVDAKGKIVLALDDIRDPGNLGTIIRIADWFGIEHIVCSLHTADRYNPKVIQSTMGSLSRVNVLYTDLELWLQAQPVSVYATTLNGKPLATIKGIKEGIIVIGNESKGISEDVLQHCTHQITIPRVGHAESLNAAVATGIIASYLI
ncbi:MAG: TrmH family RNA methyltransferase [Ferruginibacter sp.]